MVRQTESTVPLVLQIVCRKYSSWFSAIYRFSFVIYTAVNYHVLQSQCLQATGSEKLRGIFPHCDQLAQNGQLHVKMQQKRQSLTFSVHNKNVMFKKVLVKYNERKILELQQGYIFLFIVFLSSFGGKQKLFISERHLYRLTAIELTKIAQGESVNIATAK